MAFTIEKNTQTAMDPNRLHHVVLKDVALNDSDKSLDVGAELGENAIFEVERVHVEFGATATVGTRTLRLEVQDDGGDVTYEQGFNAGLNLTASQSNLVDLLPGEVFLAAIGGAAARDFLPKNLKLGASQKLRVYDAAGIDAAADDMQVMVSGTVQYIDPTK